MILVVYCEMETEVRLRIQGKYLMPTERIVGRDLRSGCIEDTRSKLSPSRQNLIQGLNFHKWKANNQEVTQGETQGAWLYYKSWAPSKDWLSNSSSNPQQSEKGNCSQVYELQDSNLSSGKCLKDTNTPGSWHILMCSSKCQKGLCVACFQLCILPHDSHAINLSILSVSGRGEVSHVVSN